MRARLFGARGVAVGLLARQVLVLAAIFRAGRFLGGPPKGEPGPAPGGKAPTFFIVVPMLREAGGVAEAVEYFDRVMEGHTGRVIVVTTAREAAEAPDSGRKHSTVREAEELAATDRFVHLHYPDPTGLKGDQLNLAADHCLSELLMKRAPSEAFMICYDADSRPPLDSVNHFERAIAAFPQCSIFQQSSRFELRPGSDEGWIRRWSRLVCDGGALRANRFVLGFEVPRLLNRSVAVSSVKRTICSYVYAHVTGHGLALRLAQLIDLPFPAASPLEDMHYSFYVGSRNLPVAVIPSLDSADVPDSVSAQFQQGARWFFGPARALRYLRDPMTQPGWRARVIAASALGSSVEWLGCAVIPPLTVFLVFWGEPFLRACAAAVVLVYGVQLAAAEILVGSPIDSLCRRVSRIMMSPLATIVFGGAGFVGGVRLVRGGSGIGKTERRRVA